MAAFDTLRAARRLKEAGASDQVAEAIAETIGDARTTDLAQLATKTDLAVLRADLAVLRADFATLRADVEARIAAVEARLIKWLIGVGVAASVAIVGALSGVIWAATQALLHAR
ncbi:MAG: hypothetical protein WA417_16415 [Stellaceae bacterium]